MSGWSAFWLGARRPELTVLGVGEFERPIGDDWGVMLRDLRTGLERIVFDEAEWRRIKKYGLPPVGVAFGEEMGPRPELPPEVERLITVEGQLLHARQPTADTPEDDPTRRDPNNALFSDDGLFVDGELEGFIDNYLADNAPHALTDEEIYALAAAAVRGTDEDRFYKLPDKRRVAIMYEVAAWAVRAKREEPGKLAAVLAGRLGFDAASELLQLRPTTRQRRR
jgi:hypothetical protein